MKCAKAPLKGWKDIPEGGTIVESGSSILFDVSAWRTSRPVFDHSKCTKCGMCWLSCPDAAIKANADGRYDVEMMYCKGCGICEKVCAVKAIKMEKEDKE